MIKAIYNGAVIAETEQTVRVEGNHYFPPEAMNKAYFQATEHNTICPWKGTASYYDIVVDGKVYRNGAWYYPTPSKAAEAIKDHVAFYGGVNIESDEAQPTIIDRLKGALK